MNQKKLVLLGIVLAVVLAIFAATSSSNDSSKANAPKEFFGDINPQKIYRIKIDQGEKGVELELRGDTWTIPSKAGYQADEGKVRALLVKLLDLSVSQEVTNNPAKFETLGVGDDVKKSGRTKIEFFDTTGKSISGVLLGEQRKRPKDSDYLSSVGQYLRRVDQQVVYLLPQVFTFDPALSNWMSLDIVNILQSRILGVSQYQVANGVEKPVFELIEAANSSANPREFVLKGDLPAGQILDASVIAQVRSGLENTRVMDVFPAADPAVQGLNFNQRTVYRINNGLEYSVSTAEKEKKTYGKISVVFNPNTARELTEAAQRRADEAKAQAAASSSAADPAAAASPAPDGSSSSSAAVEAPKAEPLSNQEEAGKLNSQFSGWVYEIAEFNSKKYRSTREQLSKKPDPQPAAPPAPGPEAARPGGGQPRSLSDLVNGISGPQ